MRDLRAHLPPLNALAAFEAAARLLSFTRAAQELQVSRESVSRHVRNLEDHLGCKLFRRLYRAIALTEAGDRLSLAVQDGLGTIAQAAVELRQEGGRDKVVVSATIAIASYWLTPRLPHFRAAHPGTEIRVLVSDSPPDLNAEAIDLGLRYGDGNWPGLAATRLFETTTFLVCAPAYLEAAGPLDGSDDLINHSLLNLEGPNHETEDWQWWFTGLGRDVPPGLRLLSFDNYATVIQAAVEGQGVALGFGGIVDGLVEKGALIRPLETTLRRGLAVHLVVPKPLRLTPSAQRFHDWVLAEAAVA